MANKITISIPEELEEKLQEKIKETNFKSVQDYILYILEQIVSESAGEIKSKREQAYTEEEEKDIAGDPEMLESLGMLPKHTKGYTQKEEEELKKNLEDLGYL